jgi:hypothetical protein
MGRKTEGAGLMKQRIAQTASGRVYRLVRGARPGYVRNGMMLCIALFALHYLARSVLCQKHPIAPTPVILDVSKPLPAPLQYRFDGKAPQAKTELEVKGNGEWRFIRFEQFPAQIVLKVDGKPDGYLDSEQLTLNKWYSFKNSLPVILEIKPEATMPVELVFSFGTAGRGREDFWKNPDLKAEDVRKFPAINPVNADPPQQSLKLFWEPFATTAASASPTPSLSPSPPIEPAETPMLTYLIDVDPLVGVFVLLIGLIVLGVFIVFGVPIIAGILDWFRRRRGRKPSRPKGQSRPSPVDSLSVDIEPGAQGRSVSKQTAVKQAQGVKLEKFRNDEVVWVEEERPRTHPTGAPVYPQSQSPGSTAARPSGLDQRGVEQLIDKRLEPLQAELKQKISKQDHNNLVNAAKTLDANLKSIVDGLDQRLNAKVKPIEDLMNDHSVSVKKELDKTASDIRRVTSEGVKAREQLQGLMTEVGKVEGRLKTRLAELDEALSRQTVPDSFIAKTLGAVLGQSVETLRQDHFDQLFSEVGERLNQFFQTGVGRAEGLQELRVRSEGINTALKEVSLQMERLNPQATSEARPKMQRVEALVTELIGLQAELQTRRATITTTLRIPVSTHAGARQTFLDELGRGIRREIGKLNDPESYFEGELERIVTSDLIAIVDICDKKVALTPGARPELESALKKLFDEAGLRSIVPRQGEPFKTAEQDLIEMDKGAGQSLTVAQVMTRGFYYTHRANETLLRKAGVTVYR